MDTLVKTCTACNDVLPYEAFNKFTGAKDGLQSCCRNCQSIRNRLIRLRKRVRLIPFREYRMLKVCLKCSKPKTLEQFNTRKVERDGLDTWCVDCRHSAAQQYDFSIADGTNRCKLCDQEKPVTEFVKSRTSSLGVTARCKECDRNDRREKHLLEKYGMTLEQRRYIWESQGRCCAICQTDIYETSRYTHVDHCHETGKVRGLLCLNCNAGIGNLDDSEEILSRAIDYLRLHKEVAHE